MQKRYVVVIEMFNTNIAFVDWFYTPDMGGHFWAFVFLMWERVFWFFLSSHAKEVLPKFSVNQLEFERKVNKRVVIRS